MIGDPARARVEPGLSGRALFTLWLTVCLDMVGFGIILPVLPFHAERFGATPAAIAYLAAAFSLAQLVAAPLLGRLGDRVGRRPVLLLSIAGSCASMLLLAVANDLAWLFVARLCAGACGAKVPTAQAYVADRCAPERRAKALGRVGSAIGVGFVLGPAIGALLTTPSWPALPFVAAAGLSVCNWVLAFVWLPEARNARARPTPRGPRATLRRSPVLALIGLNLGLFVAFAGMESTFALLLEARLGWGASEVGLLFTLIGVTIVLSQGVVVGRVVARLGERGTLRVGLVVLSLGLAGLGAASHAPSLIVAACAVALGNGLVSPSLSALISQGTEPSRQGATLGLASAAASLGRVLGPVGAGSAFELLGPGSPALLGAGVTLVMLACTGARLRGQDQATASSPRSGS
ncbi:Tetracycline resistance protein, class B [Enhygromyxa salina]|uniref:Tetracycline resistance protein, class B n=1 Tax=Enhygromyxa salina TaxID=215803 RepID=A0A2S9XIB9_9BACT|nr:MFS transporter [Enhygromyxa salina]PRP92615.1 Tetracycline resistance protein, class B [Enhygromyxa salina]